jgi:hypothetical protein
MTENPNPVDSFYDGALKRITRLMLVFSFAAVLVGEIFYGWRIALGLVCGCTIACLNFYWLKRVVSALADKVTESGKAQAGGGVVTRFLLRYFLMGGAAYAIFTVSPTSLPGLFIGLFVPVAAIVGEAAYEAYAVLVRGL